MSIILQAFHERRIDQARLSRISSSTTQSQPLSRLTIFQFFSFLLQPLVFFDDRKFPLIRSLFTGQTRRQIRYNSKTSPINAVDRLERLIRFFFREEMDYILTRRWRGICRKPCLLIRLQVKVVRRGREEVVVKAKMGKQLIVTQDQGKVIQIARSRTRYSYLQTNVQHILLIWTFQSIYTPLHKSRTRIFSFSFSNAFYFVLFHSS